MLKEKWNALQDLRSGEVVDVHHAYGAIVRNACRITRTGEGLLGVEIPIVEGTLREGGL